MISRRRYLCGIPWLAVAMLTACAAQLSEQDLLAKSLEHEAKGEINAAIIEIKNALQKNPENGESRLHLGELSLRIGDLVSAEKELQRAKNLGIPHSRIQIPLGRALLGQRNFTGVIKEVDPAQAQSTQDRQAGQLMRGEAFLGLKDIAGARNIFRTLLASDRHNTAALTGMAQVELASGNTSRAEAYLSRALTLNPDSTGALIISGAIKNQQQKFIESERYFSHALKKLPSDRLTGQIIVAHAGIAEALLGQEKTAAAKQHIDALLAQIPEHPVANYLNGYAEYQAGNLVGASNALQKVLGISPGHQPSLILLGAVNYGRGNLEQAAALLTRAFAADSANLSVRKLLAATRLQLNQPEQALSALSDGGELLNGDAYFLSLAGIARIATGDAGGGLAALEQSVEEDPGNRDLRLKLAGGYIRTRQADKALRALDKLPSSTADFRRESLLINAYLLKNQPDRAESIAAALVKQNPRNAMAHNLAGMTYFSTGKVQIAREQFLQTIEIEPNSVNALTNLGRMEYKASAYAEAQAYFERALRVSPDNAMLMTLLGYSSQGQGDAVSAIEWFEKARSGNPAAIDARLALIRHYLPKQRRQLALNIALEAARAAPENPIVLNALGVVQMWTEEHKNALGSFREVVRLAPKSSDALLNLARAYIALREIPKARAALKRALVLSPDHSFAVSTLAMLETRQGNYRIALNMARQQQNKQPQQASGYVLEGDVHMLNDQPVEAAAAYAKAQRQGQSQALVLKSFMAQRSAKMPGAKNSLGQWLKINPQDTKVRVALALAHHEDGDENQAGDLYREIIKSEPNAVTALNNLAWIYFLQDNEESVELAERAHQLAPGAGVVTDTLGWILFKRGETQRGVKYLRQAARESPDNADIQYHLAVALSDTDNMGEARSILEKILKSDSVFENMDNASKLLNSL